MLDRDAMSQAIFSRCDDVDLALHAQEGVDEALQNALGTIDLGDKATVIWALVRSGTLWRQAACAEIATLRQISLG